MSGIVGLYRADGRPADAALLARMTGALAERVADVERRWVRGPVGLAQRLLYTTPESLDEAGPAADASGDCRLAWDGRLDNRDELIEALGPDGAGLGRRPDPDLVLGAYRRWGADVVRRLLGDFAFVLWDGGARRLLCARDRLGLRPLHYTWDGVTLGVSTEARPLFALRGGVPAPDDEMIVAFLLREFRERDHARSFFRGIHRLPPGHLLRVEQGRLRIERYWAIDPTRETRYPRDEDYVRHFRDLFAEAVRCRRRSAFPVGAFLSGGLDSAAVVAAAGAQHPLEAFTLFADDPGADERRWARAVGQATGVKTHEVAVAEGDPLDGLDRLVGQVESPIVASGHGRSLAAMQAVTARGSRVLLSGDGGDHLLDEIGYLADLLRRLRLGRFVGETRAFAGWYGSEVRTFAGLALAALLPPVLRFWGKRILRGVPPAWINRDLARAIGLRERLREPRHRLAFPSHAQAESYLAVTSPYFLLKLEVDERFTARWGTEARYPFLDSRLVEFVLSIPWERRTRDGERKRILRAALPEGVPAAVRRRRGKGDWTRLTDRQLLALCRRERPAPLANRSGLLGRYLDLGQAQALVRRYAGGERSLRGDVWFAITLDRWLERFWGGHHG